jgi:lipoprotein-releasing system ATP-binding protein
MSEVVLKARGLTRRLEGDIEVTLVENIDLEIARGEFVAITGPSGSGKSSLLYLLGLLDVPSSGQLWLEGTETSQFDEQKLADIRLSRLGFVFQSNFLLPEFSATENVLLPIQRLGRLKPAQARERAASLLTDLGLASQSKKLPKQMSGGQNQRVAIARALANEPTVILADEPTGNLDTVSSAMVQNILKDLSRKSGRTVIIVTHDPAFAAQCDRTIHVVDGHIVDGGTI